MGSHEFSTDSDRALSPSRNRGSRPQEVMLQSIAATAAKIRALLPCIFFGSAAPLSVLLLLDRLLERAFEPVLE